MEEYNKCISFTHDDLDKLKNAYKRNKGAYSFMFGGDEIRVRHAENLIEFLEFTFSNRAKNALDRR